MSQLPFSDEVAVRIGLAARALPDVSIGELIAALEEQVGPELDEVTLSRITVTNLKIAFGKVYDMDGELAGEEAGVADIANLKKAVRILWGETEEGEDLLPIEPYQEGEMPDSIRVAVASNAGEQLDGHFGSCLRYLVYQLSATDLKLIDVRSAAEADLSEDKNGFRARLIKDCHVLYIVSVGGPAAAKIIKTGIYPMKRPEGGDARQILHELQQVIATAPPPWLAKVLGVAVGDRVRNYKAGVI